MAKYVFLTVLIFLAILGLSEIIHIIKKWILSSLKSGKRIIILVVSNNDFHREILNLYFDFKWQGYKLAQEIFIDNSDIGDENIDEFRALIKKTGFKVLKNINFQEAE